MGQTSDAELEKIIGEGGRRGEIYAGLRRLRDTYSDLIQKRYPNIPRRVSGYNLNYLLPENGFHVARALVGSEGTCVTVLEASCRLVESPPERVLLVIAYPDIFQCADRVPEIMAHGPIGLEGVDDLLVEFSRRQSLNLEGLALLPPGGGWLFAEFGATSAAEAETQARELMRTLSRGSTPPQMCLFTGQAAGQASLGSARIGLGSDFPRARASRPAGRAGRIPLSLPRSLVSTFAICTKLMTGYGYRSSLYGHFGHACVHMRINFDLQSTKGIANYRKFVEEAADLVVSYGGSLSGEHGDGQSRAELLPKMFGPELVQAFREFKALWDPDWKMNPGKVVEPYKLDENLRLGADYKPWEPQTHFQFPEDHGSSGECHIALRRSGQMPPRRRRSHVSKFSRHSRGGTLHPRPRPPALGDDQGRRNSGSVARPARERLARFVSRLQRMQERLPGRRRCGHLQSGVLVALLRRTGAVRAAHTPSGISTSGLGSLRRRRGWSI